MNEKVKNEINKACWYEQRQTLGNNNMKLKPYPKYKDSGIQWIGEIPEGWEIRKVKQICSKSAEYGLNEPSDNYVDGGVRFLRITDIIENERLIEDGVYLPENKTNKEYLLNTGDVLVARSGSIGTSLYFDKEKYGGCLFAGYLVRFVVNKSNNGKFLYYFTNSKSFYAQIELETIQTTIGNFNGQKYANMRIAIPPLPEQTTITNFLDLKTARIDTLIKKDKKLIELLKEKRAALINHAVTKGLDPNVKMKDSGIDWIGEIPEGWEVKKLKFSVCEKKIKDTTKNPNTKFIGLEHIESETGKLISSSTLEDIDGESVRFKKNNVLFGKLRPYLAKIIKVDFQGSCTGELIVYEARGKIDSKFLFYRLLSKGFIDLVNSTTYGVKMPRADPTQLSNIKIAWPPLPEQTTIVNFLEKATVKMDKTIQKIEQKIKFLEEYKKSLIHHTVTGKIDVREVKI